MMKIPANIQRYVHPIATVWFDDNILCIISNPGPRTVETISSYFSFLDNLLKGRKIPAVADISNAWPMDPETMNFSSRKLENYYRSLAIISRTHTGGDIAEAFINLNAGFPIRLFDNEKEARYWLKTLSGQHVTAG